MDLLPVLHCAHTASCSARGTSLCSGCNLVKYCSKECQKSHWKVHKKDCKGPLSEKAWAPAWIAEKRTPAFVTDDNGPMVTQHGLNKFLWGNTPAFDHVQLLRNEGEKWDQPLALCFAASGSVGGTSTVGFVV